MCSACIYSTQEAAYAVANPDPDSNAYAVAYTNASSHCYTNVYAHARSYKDTRANPYA